MNRAPLASVAVTGMGVICSVGRSVPEFGQAIRSGTCGITHLPDEETQSIRVAAVIRNFSWEQWLQKLRDAAPALYTRVRNVSANMTESTRLSACAAVEAFIDSRLGERKVDPSEIGVIVAGSNLSQDYIARNRIRFTKSGRPEPRYALCYSDSHQVGCLSEIFSVYGPGLSVGAAAASGNAALFQAFHWIRSGVVKTCLVVGACTELTGLELEAFAILGAAACGRRASDPGQACRPFDEGHEGFVWGQGSACVILEARDGPDGVPYHASIAGASLLLEGNHLPALSAETASRSMRAALDAAGLIPGHIGYINAHGSSSPLGDRAEVAAIKAVFEPHLSYVKVNSTKSLTGHCFSASGVMELIASVLQLKAGFLHPNRNLVRPIDPDVKFAGSKAEPLDADFALSNGFGFGGFNSSIVIGKATS